MTLSIETIKGVYIPKDAPSWITSKHIVDCSNNNSLQENWIPNVNDWYLCGDLWKVLQIINLENYYFDCLLQELLEHYHQIGI